MIGGVACLAPPTQKIKGMAFTTGHEPYAYRRPEANAALKQLRKTGTEYVHLTTILGMEHTHARTAYNETTDETIVYAIRQARRHGFKVFLKPIVQTRNLVWRGFIPPSQHFFRNIYTPYIVRIGRIAQRENVSILSVGSELKATVRQKKEWNLVIRQVRLVFKRHLTYVANHDSYRRVSFWQSLDFISISSYFELLDSLPNGKSPDLAHTKKLWLGVARRMLMWRKNAKLGNKKILIAEVGAMSKGNGVVYLRPWDYAAHAPTDFDEQLKIYEGFFNAFMKPAWCLGIILWNWEASPNAGKSTPTLQGYTPQNKPALKVMIRYFKQSD